MLKKASEAKVSSIRTALNGIVSATTALLTLETGALPVPLTNCIHNYKLHP